MCPQFTPEQRNCLVMGYGKYKGTQGFFPILAQEFEEKFPGVQIPHRSNIIRMYNKQMSSYTTHNLNSKSSPGVTHSGRPKTSTSPDIVNSVKQVFDRDSLKEMDDPTTSPVNTARKNVLGLDKSSWSRAV